MSFAHHNDVGRMDELARMDSPVHRLDARIKLLTTIAFIVAVMSFPRYQVSALMPFFLYPFALMAAGNIPPSFVLHKLLLAAPFALAVGIFNPVLDRHTIMTLGSHSISAGWLSLASIAIRFMLTVSAALTLVACTGIHRLCAGLERLGLSRVVSVQLQMLHRYLFVIAEEGVRVRRGVEMRSAGRRAIHFRTYVSLIGHLLLRSVARAQRVYQAMVSRGFDGQVRVMQPTVLHAKDIFFLTGWASFFVAARVWNLADGLGHIFTGPGS